MAYMDQDKKAKIKAALDDLKLPKPWKLSLSVRHYSTLIVSIVRAPATVLDDYIPTEYQLERPGFTVCAKTLCVNEHNLANNYRGSTLRVLTQILETIRTAGEWFDKSDSQSDYFHVAFWLDIRFGNSNREVELVGQRRTKSQTIIAVADKLGVPVIDIKLSNAVGSDLAGDIASPSLASGAIVIDNLSAHDPVAGRDNVISLFATEQRDPALAEKLAVARFEMVRRYRAAFRNTPAGAALSDEALTVLAEAALKVTVD